MSVRYFSSLKLNLLLFTHRANYYPIPPLSAIIMNGVHLLYCHIVYRHRANSELIRPCICCRCHSPRRVRKHRARSPQSSSSKTSAANYSYKKVITTITLSDVLGISHQPSLLGSHEHIEGAACLKSKKKLLSTICSTALFRRKAAECVACDQQGAFTTTIEQQRHHRHAYFIFWALLSAQNY